MRGERGLFLMEAMWSRTNPLLRKGAELVGVGRARPDPARQRRRSASRSTAIRRIACWIPTRPAARSSTWASTRSTWSTCSSANPTELYRLRAAVARPASTSTPRRLLTYERDRVSGPPPPRASSARWSTDLPTRLEVFCAAAARALRQRDPAGRDGADWSAWSGRAGERFVTQWPGGGYTFQDPGGDALPAQRRACESPLVPWADTLAVARTLDRWQASYSRLSAGGRYAGRRPLAWRNWQRTCLVNRWLGVRVPPPAPPIST